LLLLGAWHRLSFDYVNGLVRETVRVGVSASAALSASQLNAAFRQLVPSFRTQRTEKYCDLVAHWSLMRPQSSYNVFSGVRYSAANDFMAAALLDASLSRQR